MSWLDFLKSGEDADRDEPIKKVLCSSKRRYRCSTDDLPMQPRKPSVSKDREKRKSVKREKDDEANSAKSLIDFLKGSNESAPNIGAAKKPAVAPSITSSQPVRIASLMKQA